MSTSATVSSPRAQRLKPEALQQLMRHKSYQTTLRCVNLANRLEEAVAAMPLPEVLRTGT